MSVIFNNESRPDLAASIRTDYTAEYIYPKILPVINVYEESGVISVAQNITASADENRAYSADLTLNHLGNAGVNFLCSGYESRIACSDTDLKLKGDSLDLIQAEMANAGGEAVVGKMETAAEAALFAGAGASVTATSGAPFAAIAEAGYKVAPYGTPYLVCSQYWLSQMLQYEGFTAPILKLFGEGVIAGLLTGSDKVAQSVGAWCGLGGILIGKDTFWKNGSHTGNAFVVARRPEMEEPGRAYWTAKVKPVLGATLTFLPRDTEGNPWFVDTTYLPGPKINAVDVGIKAQSRIFNGGAACKIALPT